MKKISWVTLAGVLMLLAGASCIVIKAVTGEYLDSQGVLHENFFLLPMGFGLMLIGAAVCLVTGIMKLIRRKK